MHDCSSQLINTPEDEKAALLGQLADQHFSGVLRHIKTQPILLAQQLLPLATSFSQAPVSGYHVGAVAVGQSGCLYLGANLEFVGNTLSASLHAEQSAVLNAWIHGESMLEAIVVSAIPCGHCRQFLCEVSDAASLKIIFGQHATTLEALLPNSFGAPRIAGTGLLDSQPFELEPLKGVQSNSAKSAIAAACESYAPYTQAPEGCVIECVDGHLFSGRSAESSAFNPSVPAITCALNQRNLSASRFDAIHTCTHAKLATSQSAQSSFTKAILAPMSNVSITSILMEKR